MSIKLCRHIYCNKLIRIVHNKISDLTKKINVSEGQKYLKTLLSLVVKESFCNFMSYINSDKEPYLKRYL